jgi:hypothetical protein
MEPSDSRPILTDAERAELLARLDVERQDVSLHSARACCPRQSDDETWRELVIC